MKHTVAKPEGMPQQFFFFLLCKTGQPGRSNAIKVVIWVKPKNKENK